ncbi:MAG: TolC family outer membrane protein [Pseudomonadota bacterium]|nr:type I secretion protein TolC [Pseudomonadota bacterium]QKK06484.1 MAG: TolC family outer membrane protein [Pseudomonadota bacterium]
MYKRTGKKFWQWGAAIALSCLMAVPAMAETPAIQVSGKDKDVTLMDAIGKGLIMNPEYRIVANDRRATDEELEQAKALWKPSVDFIGETGWEYTDSPSINEESLWHNRASLTLTQLLFDGYGTQSEIKRQTARVESTSNRVAETAEFLGLSITEAFFDVLRQRDLLSISRANVQDHLKILDTISQGVSSGTATEGDLAQAEARLASSRATEASIRQSLREAEALFIRQAGEMPENLVFPNVPRDLLPQSVENAVTDAVTKSPTLAVFESDIDVAHAEFEGSGSTLYPQVNLEVNGTASEDINGIQGSDTRASALAVVRWNLFRGGGDKARQREFMYRHAIAKKRRADAARQVEKDVRDTWAGMVAASERAARFLEQANANEKVVGVYLDQFSLDRRTLLDVLDAQNELFVSRSSHVNALYTEIFGIYRLLALQGQLLDSVGVERPREASLAN